MTNSLLKMELQPTSKRRKAYRIKNETMDCISYFKIFHSEHAL